MRRIALSLYILIAAITLSASITVAAGFDCGKASSADERAICSDDRLSFLDDDVNEAYDKAVRSYGGNAVRPIARKLLKERRQCGADTECIARVQGKAIEIYKRMAGEVEAGAGPQPGDTIPYGTRAGMEVTVVQASGIDTNSAVIEVKHTRANATAYCRDYVQEVSESCIREELNVQLNDRIEAACGVKIMTTLSGQEISFAGENDASRQEQGEPKYLFYDITDRTNLDGSMASGYPVVEAQFMAVCPGLFR